VYIFADNGVMKQGVDMSGKLLKNQKIKQRFGWIGAFCLLLIIPIKTTRWMDENLTSSLIVGIAPSFLGPAGLLFLIISNVSKLSHHVLIRVTWAVAAIAFGLETLQLIPRPGILAKVHYTFDWLDLIASGFSIGLAFLIAYLVLNQNRKDHKTPG
jgi:hypothetical protein